jgi:ribosomal protein L7/L12
VSAGSRKILVINAFSTLTGMRLREAEDLVDKAPGLVMHQVTSERADKAK